MGGRTGGSVRPLCASGGVRQERHRAGAALPQTAVAFIYIAIAPLNEEGISSPTLRLHLLYEGRPLFPKLHLHPPKLQLHPPKLLLHLPNCSFTPKLQLHPPNCSYVSHISVAAPIPGKSIIPHIATASPR